MVTSVVDYIFRVLALDYLHRTDYCQVKPGDLEVQQQLSLTESATEAEAMQEQAPAPGKENPAPVPTPRTTVAATLASSGAPSSQALDSYLSGLMGDAPFCDICGHLTIRNGPCYKCLNCGNSIGCS